MNADRRSLGIALVGYGRMGHAIEQAALARGHRIHCCIDPAVRGADAQDVASAPLEGADVALEFTRAAVAEENVRALLEAGVPVVSGSTGWNDRVPAMVDLARDRGVGFLWAPNYSLGVQVLFRLTRAAASWFGALGGFAPFLLEEHHAAKADAPSGTARRLAEILVRETPGKERFGVAPADAPVPVDMVPVAWVRAGAIPGTHRIGWDAAGETIEIVHRARDRAVFAAGAVVAAEWLRAHPGPHSLEEMLDDVLPPMH